MGHARIGAVVVLCGLLGQAGTEGYARAQETVQKNVYQDEGRRDPFWPLVNEKGAIINYDKDLSTSDMILEGILVGVDGKNAAIINGVVVGVGDRVGLLSVTEIRPDTVVLRNGDKEFTLKLKTKEE